MFAEQRILELSFQGRKDEVRQMLSDMFLRELLEFQEKLESIIDEIDDIIEEQHLNTL